MKILRLAALVWMAGAVGANLFGQVLTWHNDNFRTGQNLQETALTPANVNASTFGRLFTIGVDGRVDAEPLYVPGLAIPSQGLHNVLFVVTEHDSVYAFDADTGTQLWHVSMLLMSETASDDRGCGQVTPEIGVTSTPVIDPQAGPHGTMYVVAMSKNGSIYHQRLHALDLTTGGEQFGGPMEVQATFPKLQGTVTFDPTKYKERAGLLIFNGVVYTSWASHCDSGPYSAWVIGYNELTLSQASVLNLTPNGSDGSVWAAGAGPAADANGNIFTLIANGTFDTTLDGNGFPSKGDYGNAFVKIAAGGTSVADYFTMDNTVNESNADQDLGSGGAMLLPPVNDTQGHPRDLAVGAGKDQNIYVVDRANMGKFNPNTNSAIYQELPSAVGSVFSSPAWFNGTLYYGGVGDRLKAFAFTSGMFGSIPASQTATGFGYPGTTPSISANGTANGIVWAAENANPAVLHAYDATNLATELYNSNIAANNRDHFGAGNKFIVPMVANGKVYVGTTNGVGVFGLFCGCTILPTSMSYTAAGGSGTVNVTTQAGCSWVASSNAGFLSITSGPGGTGSGVVSYTVTANSGVPRSGTLTIAGQTFTVTQAGSNLPPSNVSVTPSSGNGTSQTFSFVFSDPNGYTDLSTTYMLINSVLNWPGSCYTFYDRSSNVLWLLNDAGNFLLGPVTPGSTTTVQNSQCTLSGAGSSVSGLGNNLTVNVALTFKGAFGGAKSLYLNAQDSGGLWSNWQTLGTWTVPVGGNLPPSNVSVTPSSGNGTSQTFSFVFSDPNGYTDLSTTYMLINSVLNWPGSCYTFYDRNANVLWLLNDAGNSLLGPVTPGSATTVQNSQCTLSGAGSTVSGLGSNLTVNVALTFKGAFGGAKNVYLNAQDSGGLWSNWQSRGTWTVPAAGNLPPSNVSVTPSSGTGSSQTFSFVFSDPNGYTDLSTTYMLINSVLNWPGSCYTFYDRNANVLWLLNDAGNSLLGPVTPGGAATAQNSQCVLNGAGSTVSGLGNNLTVNVALTFKAAFGGAKNVYLNAQDSGGLWSNWQPLGTWTVPVAGNLPPSNVSVTPSSGSGLSQTFSFVFSDPNGYTDLSTTYMLINSVLNWPGSCYTFYDRSANVLWLLNDAGNTELGPVTPGSTTTVQNSQCTLNGAGSTVSGLGNNLTVNVALTFKAAFGGAKNVYLNAQDSGGLWSNWQPLGTWTVQ